MSIMKMKKLRLLAMRSEREQLLRELQRLGCVHLREDAADEEELKRFASEREDPAQLMEFRAEQTRTAAALKLLDKYAHVKTGLFPTLPEVKLEKLFSPELPEAAQETLDKLEQGDAALSALFAEQGRLRSSILSLELWRGSGIPLDVGDTEHAVIRLGTIPAAKSAEALETALREATEAAQLIPAGQNREQQGLAVVYLRDEAETVGQVLRNFGFNPVAFEGMSGGAEENLARLEQRLQQTEKEQEQIRAGLKELGAKREELKLYYDRLSQEIETEEAKGRLLMSEQVFLLEGWLLAEAEPKLNKLLESRCCAWETEDPAPEDDVPVKLRNNKLTSPLNMVTEMYSLPQYKNVDPNPLIAFWFCAFFGIMYADAGYGLVLLLLGLIVGPKIRKPGMMKYMTGLLVECGIATFIFGWLFGSFFGDVLRYIPDFFGTTLDMTKVPLWGIKDPSADPMWFMYASLAVGGLHLLAGMLIKAYILIRDGHPFAALFDVGSWLLLFAGIGVGAVTGSWWVALAGALALVLTQGRDRPTIIGKAVGGFKSLYDITSWLGDILSYTRLMALMLAGSVIAQVFNMLANMAGNAVSSKIVGLILFLVIFFVTQLFNMAINIIGTFVHAARLQYLEFFGKFYEDGGKPFKPLSFKTKYTDIIKEEN